jgi:anti-anti-sigma regulatory factor
VLADFQFGRLYGFVSLENCKADLMTDKEIIALVEKHHCQTLAFDLSGVKLIPSGMLGLLASLRRMNIMVHLYNPSPDIAEVLQITRLSEVLPIHYIDLDAQRE